MAHTMALRRSSVARASTIGSFTRPVLALLAVAGLFAGLVLLQDRDRRAVDAASANVWLSGETVGRVVLGAARSERPSLSVQLTEQPTAFDVVEFDRTVAVHDRGDGLVVLLGAGDGREVARVQGPAARDERSVIVGAGDRAYLVDPSVGTIVTVRADGATTSVTFDDLDIADWVATGDGLLWLTAVGSTDVWSFDGDRLEVVPGADAGAGTDLVSVGEDPVLFDPTTARLRWIRRDETVEIPGVAPGADPADIAIAQASSGSCATVLTAGGVVCVGLDGTERVGDLDTAAIGSGSRSDLVVVGNDTQVVIARAGSATVVVFDWASGDARSVERRTPSARLPRGVDLSGAVVLDDPGSPYALSITPSSTVEFDKFSKLTIVLTSDGSISDQGLGSLDATADVEGAIGTGGPQQAPSDDDGRNEPPTPADDRAVTRTDRSITIGVLGNDTDPDGDPLAIVGVSTLDPAEGNVVVLEGSQLRYEPPSGTSNSTVTFEYEVADILGERATATVEVDVIGDGSNTDPMPVDDEATTNTSVSVAIPVLVNDRDGEGDPLTITTVTEGANGTIAIDGSSLQYEPRPGFVGTDEFEYTVIDGFGGEASATVVVDVVDQGIANRAPTAVADRVTATAGQLSRFDPLANDSDPDGDRIHLVRTSTLAKVTLIPTATGSVDILAAADVVGLLTFTYVVADDRGLETTGRVTLVVAAPKALEPPIAVDDRGVSASVPVTIDVVANDLDPAGGQLVLDTVTPPSASTGSIQQLSPTTIRFSPATGFVGTARMSYTVRNLAGLTDAATITIEVRLPTGSGPIAKDDQLVAYLGDPVVIRALDNDSHTDGLPFSYVGLPSTSQGTAKITADRAISFTPPPGQLGAFVIRYTIQDEYGLRSSAVITVQIQERPLVNTAPLASDDVRQTTFGTAITIDAAANDRDPDNDTLTVTDVTQPANGRAEVVSGRVRYTPTAQFSGLDAFTYTISDGRGLSAVGRVTVDVGDRPRVPPVVVNDVVPLLVGQSTTVSPLANDNDPDGSGELRLLQVLSVTPPEGLVVRQSGNTVRVTSTGVIDTFVIPYTVIDGDQQVMGGAILVNVSPPPNSPPVASNDAFSGLAQRTVLDVLANDFDPDGGSLTLLGAQSVAPASAGTASVAGNRLVFEPDKNFGGTVTIRYAISDDRGADTSATVTLVYVACPVVPSPSPLSFTTKFETPVNVALDTDGVLPAGWRLSVSQPIGGTVVLPEGSTVARFTPAAGFDGEASFSYVVRTSCDDPVTSRVSILVNQTPVAVDDGPIQVTRNRSVVVPVLGNDFDPDGEPVVIDQVRDFVNGTAVISGNTITFTPTSGYVGAASFRYNVRDAARRPSAFATVTLSVGNTAPIADDEVVAMVRGGGAIDVDVLNGDRDPDGDPLRISNVTGDLDGYVIADWTDQMVTLRLRPNTPLGTYLLSYQVTDGDQSATGRITVQVDNLAPIANPDQDRLDLAVGSSSSTDVLANDDDPDGRGPLQLMSADAGALGSATVEGRSVRFVPASGVLGFVVVNYVVSDADGSLASGILIVEVVDTRPPPTDPPA